MAATGSGRAGNASQAEQNRKYKRKISARVTDDEYNELQKLAAAYRISIARIIRISIGIEKRQLKDRVVFTDPEKEKALRSQLTDIMNEMQGIRTELRKIGVNYNQLAKLKNTFLKMKGTQEAAAKSSGDQKKKLESQTKELKRQYYDMTEEFVKGNVVFSPESLTNLMKRYDKATKEAAEAIWRILT